MSAPAVFAATFGSILMYPSFDARPAHNVAVSVVTFLLTAWPMAHPTNPEQSAASAAEFL